MNRIKEVIDEKGISKTINWNQRLENLKDSKPSE